MARGPLEREARRDESEEIRKPRDVHAEGEPELRCNDGPRCERNGKLTRQCAIRGRVPAQLLWERARPVGVAPVELVMRAHFDWPHRGFGPWGASDQIVSELGESLIA